MTNATININGKSPLSAGEFDSLYHQFIQSYFKDDDLKRAKEIAKSLEVSLDTSHEFALSIRGEEVRSLIAELRDDLSLAIHSREAEIRKILELHARTVNTPSWNYVSRLYDFNDVSDRLDLLAILYDKHGDLDRAIAVLLESKEYCQTHEIRFDSQDLLEELGRAQGTKSDGHSSQPAPQDVLDRTIRKIYKRFGKSADEIVVSEEISRRFSAQVNQQLPKGYRASILDLKRRLLTLGRRSETRGGLPRLKE